MKSQIKPEYRRPAGWRLFGIEAISSLTLLFEKILEEKEFSQTRHLIVSDSKELEKLRAFLCFKKPKIQWLDLPPFPQPKSLRFESIRMKRRKWQAWANFSEEGPRLFLASPQALLKKTNSSLIARSIKKGERVDSSITAGYEEMPCVEKAGEFSSRGFLMDIFSPAYDSPLRIQLSGDHLQSIHLLDKEFKRRQRELEQALIPSLYEWGWTGEDRQELCDYLRKREKQLDAALPQELFQSLSRGRVYSGFEHLLNGLNSACSLDLFPRPPQIWLFEPEKAQERFLEEKSNLEKESPFFTSESLFEDWRRIEEPPSPFQKSELKTQPSAKPEKAGGEPLPLKAFPAKLNPTHFSLDESKPQPETLKAFKAHRPLIQVRGFYPSALSSKDQSPAPASLTSFSSSLFKKSQNLKEDLKRLPVRNIIFTGPQSNEVKKLLLKEKVLKSPEDDFLDEKNLIFLSAPIKESFFCQEDSAYLRAEDFTSKKSQNLSHFEFFRQRAQALEFSKLETGDLLVHRQHGVGEFAGLKTLKISGKKEDFIVLIYKGGDKLFAPAYRASQIKRYSRKRAGPAGKAFLDRLGNPLLWKRKKAKAKKHIQSLAIELIELYRLRKQKRRKPFAPVKKALEGFAKSFPFLETPDQTRAIQEIMADMDKDQPMDRLLTADTGFGKTEAALRACFRALENGFQVCFLAPTTVLTLQHFENFKQRFKDTAFRLEMANRFISPKKREDIFQKIKEGAVDFLIATHSAFSPKLSFKNLGLLILDEEHRFGVRQKERLLRLRQNLDVLALSATPIPRTLNMALTGIKDISVISRPPAKRKAVKLILKSWEEDGWRDIVQACRREKERGGQILFVHNRVKTLTQMAEQIQSQLPDFKIAIAQGQMDGLDRIMLDFFEKKHDLLASTNIIESGMDIPQANTLFIDRAHEMGLSQIYQLKGRVGRGALQAYCYLLFPAKDRLSALAKERLALLEKYAGLGGAFQLALNDLENRGAGSLFGSEQSGHLESLGEELYFEILNEQMAEQKDIFIEPEILLPFSAGIPETYIPEPRLRLLYYKSLSTALREEDRMAIQFELLEEFGPFPTALGHLFFLLEIRDFCKRLLIRDFKMTKQHISLAFHEKTPVSSDKILKILAVKGGKMLSGQTCAIPIDFNRFSEEAKQLLRLLAAP